MKKNTKKISNAVIKSAFTILKAYFGWMIKYSKNPHDYPIEERFEKVQTLIRKILKNLNVIYDENCLDEFYKNKTPNRNSLIICNHMAEIDPLIIIACAKQPISFIAKKEIAGIPFVSKIVKIIDGDFLDRNSLRDELRTIQNISANLRYLKNLDLCIFPEGTRNRACDLNLGEFKGGALKPGYNNKADITVLAINGTEKILSRKYFDKVYPVTIKYVTTFRYDYYKDLTTVQLAGEARQKCAEVFREIRRG